MEQQKRTQLFLARRKDFVFGIDLAEIVEIGRFVSLKPISSAQKLIVGSTVLHGFALPVADLLFAFTDEEAEGEDERNFFVATQTEPRLCIAVDELLGFFEVQQRRELVLSAEQSGRRSLLHQFIREEVFIGENVTLVIDVPRLTRTILEFETEHEYHSPRE